MKKLIALLGLFLIAGLLMLGGHTAKAANNCSFSSVGAVMILDGNCTTDETIGIPDGYSLYGDGHTITAVDPPSGHFVGAVVGNDGTTAHVRDLVIDTNSLANVCDSGSDRLRGIMFAGASGSIIDTTVLNVNQGSSGCQEGNAIEIRNAPFDGTHPNTQSVTVKGNSVANYQKGGIIVNGDVYAEVESNDVTGLGPVNFIAQNGIQFGFGATGVIKNNDVAGNVYTGGGWASGGILVYAGDANIDILRNTVDANDVGVWVIDADDATLWRNIVTGATYDGIALDAYYATVSGTTIMGNEVANNVVGIGLYGATTTNNTVRVNTAQGNNAVGYFVGYGSHTNTFMQNQAQDNLGDGFQMISDNNNLERNVARDNDGSGIVVDGAGNTIVSNRALDNGVLDIDNTGANTYSNNRCRTSTGAPVDCGTMPIVPAMPQIMSAASVDSRITAQPTE